MSDGGGHPVEILWRMQREAIAAGHVPPKQEQERPKWGGLAFGVGDLRLVTELTSVIDVVDCPGVTPVPGTQPWMRGICNVRGSLYSVVDLGSFLDIAHPLPESEGRLLVINDAELGCTLLVSKIHGLRYFSEDQRHREVSILDRAVRPYADHAFIQGNHVWGVLDLTRLVKTDKFLNVERTAVT